MISFDNSDVITSYLTNDLKYFIEAIKESDIPFDEEWLALFLILEMVQIQDCEDEGLLEEFKGNEKKYRITGSEVYSVTGVDIDYSRVMPPRFDIYGSTENEVK